VHGEAKERDKVHYRQPRAEAGPAAAAHLSPSVVASVVALFQPFLG